ncbi:hypothetical protein C8R44DRAFT_887417 [Mycena epipterygia]|nr:hypothetical protein C8R44DRAFT_887417 [Mycena epipterygia]
MPSDASLEIVTFLPLSAIATLSLVQKAWKEFVDENETKIYHNAAALHRFIPSPETTLADAIARLDFDTTALDVQGWKKFCQHRLEVERNWGGLGPSKLRKLRALGDRVFHRKPIPDSDYIIVASYSRLRRIRDHMGTSTEPTFFAYDCGYLCFLKPAPLNLIEVWRDASSHSSVWKPSPAQKVAAETSTALYGPPDVGHFVPCYTLPSPGEDVIISMRSLRLMYPTLLATAATQVHIWDITTGKHLRTLRTDGELDKHAMRKLAGIEVSQDFVLVFDSEQIRLFSRRDGNFLFHFSRSTTTFPREPTAVQLIPPRNDAVSAQWDDAAFQRQAVFGKRRKWKYSRGGLTRVGLSSCGTTLVAVTEKNRLLIIYDLKRLISGDPPKQDVALDLKIAEEYGDSRPGFLSVTPERIAVGTYRGIIVLTLDRSNAGSGSVPLCKACPPSSPVQISAAFMSLHWKSRYGNLNIAGTKLFFDAEPRTLVEGRLERYTRKRSTRRKPAAVLGLEGSHETASDPPGEQDDEFEIESDADSMPDLQSVFSSDMDGDDDEESDDSLFEEDDHPFSGTDIDLDEGTHNRLNLDAATHNLQDPPDSDSGDSEFGADDDIDSDSDSASPAVPLGPTPPFAAAVLAAHTAMAAHNQGGAALLLASQLALAAPPQGGAGFMMPEEAPLSCAFVIDTAPPASAGGLPSEDI